MQPFRMSGAVSGHQSARQRQALQIISGDGEGKGKRGRGIVGKVKERGSVGTALGKGLCAVTWACTLLSHVTTTPYDHCVLLCPPINFTSHSVL